MKHAWTTKDLQHLGLAGVAVAESDRIEDAGDARHFGRAVLHPSLADLAERGVDEALAAGWWTEDLDWREAVLPLLEHARLRLEVTGHALTRVRVSTVGVEPLEVLAPAAPAGAVHVLVGAGVAYVDLARVPAAAVRLADDGGVALRREEGGVSVARFHPVLPMLVLTPVPRPPLEEWLAGCADAWLAARIRERMEEDDPWEAVAGAGMLTRLREDLPLSGLGPEERVAVDEQLVLPFRWVRGLAQAELDEIDRLVGAEADAVGDLLASLEERLDPEADAWRAEFAEALHRRDDCEGVATLLRDAVTLRRARGERVMEAGLHADGMLAALDREAEPFVLSLPRGLLRGDERLRRARQADPDAWWADPAADDEQS